MRGLPKYRNLIKPLTDTGSSHEIPMKMFFTHELNDIAEPYNINGYDVVPRADMYTWPTVRPVPFPVSSFWIESVCTKRQTRLVVRRTRRLLLRTPHEPYRVIDIQNSRFSRARALSKMAVTKVNIRIFKGGVGI
jgi:hypothetical protein